MANLFALPRDQGVLALVGKISIAHSQLEYVLRLTIKVLKRLPLHQARDATRRDSSASLRAKVTKAAREALGEGDSTEETCRIA